MIAAYANYFESTGKFAENQLVWALQNYLDAQVVYHRIPRPDKIPAFPPPKYLNAFNTIINDLDTLLDTIFKDTRVSLGKIQTFKGYIYSTIVMDMARKLFGPGARIKPFHRFTPPPDQQQQYQPARPQPVFYDDRTILGVAPNASIIDIKKRFRYLAKVHHPDVGGDPKKFAEIKKAYDNLMHPLFAR